MTTVLNTALTGLNRNAQAIEDSARRIVASTTPRTPTKPDSSSTDDADEALAQSADTDLAAELVRQKQAEIGYQANAQVVRAADRLTGQLLDIVR